MHIELLNMNIELLKRNIKLLKACILHSWPKAACRADLNSKQCNSKLRSPTPRLRKNEPSKIELDKIEPMSENMIRVKLRTPGYEIHSSVCARLRGPVHAHMLAISAGSWVLPRLIGALFF